MLTTDGRMFEGKLEGFDNATNVVISLCQEIIVSREEEPKKYELGVYMVRGGTVVCIGEVTEEVEWKDIRGDKLKGTKNPL